MLDPESSTGTGKLSVWPSSGFISSAMKLMPSTNEYNLQNNFPKTGCDGHSIEKKTKTNPEALKENLLSS